MRNNNNIIWNIVGHTRNIQIYRRISDLFIRNVSFRAIMQLKFRIHFNLM